MTFKLWSIVLISEGCLVDTAHLRSQKCAVSEANAQFCPLILPLTIQQIIIVQVGLFSTDFNTLRKSRRLAVKSSILPKQGKAYLPRFRGYLLGIKNSPR